MGNNRVAPSEEEQGFLQPLLHFKIEVVCRFIEQKKIGIIDQRLSQSGTDPLTAA